MSKLLDPDMPIQELRLHMGEITAQETRTARATLRWANAHNESLLRTELERAKEALEFYARQSHHTGYDGDTGECLEERHTKIVIDSGYRAQQAIDSINEVLR